MASKSRVVDTLLLDAGKTDPGTRGRIERKVGEITLELLTQNEGRFSGLSRSDQISILTTSTKYKMQPDFFAIAPTGAELDSDGEYVDTIIIVSKAEILGRKRDGAAYNARLCWIEKLQDGPNGRGWYLCLAADATADVTYEIDYFREPTENDVDEVADEALLKAGVRAGLPDLFPATYERDEYKYLKRLPDHRESTGRFVTRIVMVPSKIAAKKNKLQHTIGRGG